MIDLRDMFEIATNQVEVDLEPAALAEAHRRRHRTQATLAMTAAACLVLAVVGVSQVGHGDKDPSDTGPVDTPLPTAVVTTPAVPEADATRVATQPVWNPFDLANAPRSSIAFTTILGTSDRIQPDIEPGANPIEEDPMTAVVAAWPQKDAGLRLLGTDGRWRSAPEAMETNQDGTYPPDAPAISSDGTKVAAATDEGIGVLDVTTGEVTTIAWPAAIAPPWDWAPGLRWLPDEEAFLVLHWNKPWIIELNGDAAPAPYTENEVSDVFAINPEGAVYQNDYPRKTLVTWEGDKAVNEAPFPQCQRLTAAYGLVACTTGSLQSSRSGPVVVDANTGEVVAYAPVKDPNAIYSDNGYLNTMGFLDPDTVLLMVGPMDFRTMVPGTETWHLVAWRFRDGTFERIASGNRDLRDVSITPALLK